MIFYSLDINKVKLLANKLALSLTPGVSLCLRGELGTGKTTFARLILQALDPQLTEVPSPTFTIIQQYSTLKGEVFHCDFYRLRYCEEFFELGIEEAFYTGICLLEWPEKIQQYLPKNRIDINFTIDSNSTRNISFDSNGDLNKHLLNFKF